MVGLKRSIPASRGWSIVSYVNVYGPPAGGGGAGTNSLNCLGVSLAPSFSGWYQLSPCGHDVKSPKQGYCLRAAPPSLVANRSGRVVCVGVAPSADNGAAHPGSCDGPAEKESWSVSGEDQLRPGR